MSRRSQKNTDTTPEDTMTDTDTTTELDENFVDPDDELETGEEVDLDVEEVDETEETDEPEAKDKDKAPAKPKRGDLPEGLVTPIQFAKILGERGLHTNKEGQVVRDVKPQMVYSYMKNSPQDDRLDPFDVEDSNGVKRSVLKLDDAIAWWERKNARAATRKANAAEKAKKAENKSKTSDQALVETGEA